MTLRCSSVGLCLLEEEKTLGHQNYTPLNDTHHGVRVWFARADLSK